MSCDFWRKVTNMIQQKLVLDTDQLFVASPVWYERPCVPLKMLRAQR